MPRKKHDEFDDYLEDYGEDELETLLELLDDFPEIGDYLTDDMFDSLNDDDYWTEA